MAEANPIVQRILMGAAFRDGNALRGGPIVILKMGAPPLLRGPIPHAPGGRPR